MKLFEYFKTKFDNFEDAKKWYRKWNDECGQEIPNHPEMGIYSLRSMAGHVSWYLQGKKGNYQDHVTTYISTKYGSELYFS